MGKGQLTKAIGVGMGLVILGACRSSHLEADSCLADVEANALDRALQRCNRVGKEDHTASMPGAKIADYVLVCIEEGSEC